MFSKESKINLNKRIVLLSRVSLLWFCFVFVIKVLLDLE
jgi:hypothetical protein